jgi:Bacterial SH3 domain
MNESISHLVAIAGAMAIGCLFTTNIQAKEDLKLPNPQTVLTADLNDNGTPDRIVASYFTRPILVIADRRANTCKTVTGKFVRYTMYADGQKNGKVIFEENYGSTIASYWVHRLEIGKDLDGDGRKDLVFYMGDDTSDEKTYLLQKPQGFRAVYAGGAELPSYTIVENRSLVSFNKVVLAQWNRSTEVWTSDNNGWVTGNCVAIRAQPDPKSKIVILGFDRNLLAVSARQPVGDWIAVNDYNGASGWINKKYFSFSSPVRWFK